MSEVAEEMLVFLKRGLAEHANADKARAMARYMRTTQPFYGVQRPDQVPLFRELVRRFPLAERSAWESAVLACWEQPHREEQYAALFLARSHRQHLTPASLPLFEHLIRTGAWWDLVDEVAGAMVSPVQLRHRAAVRHVIDRWIEDPSSLWVRRAALLSQLHHKGRTDAEQLFTYCQQRADEKEFFIRKAIGWALRDYSYAAPEAVRDFLVQHRERLSALSVREGVKQLVRMGLWT